MYPTLTNILIASFILGIGSTVIAGVLSIRRILKLQSSISQLIEQSKGIDAWTDVTYRVESDGRIYFKGTGYFMRITLDLIHETQVIRHAAHKIRLGMYNIVNMNVARRLALQDLTRPDLMIAVRRMYPQQQPATCHLLIHVFGVVPVEIL